MDDAVRVRGVGVEHLERDGAVVLAVVGEVDRGHPAGAQLALDSIAVREGRRQLQRADLRRWHDPWNVGGGGERLSRRARAPASPGRLAPRCLKAFYSLH